MAKGDRKESKESKREDKRIYIDDAEPNAPRMASTKQTGKIPYDDVKLKDIIEKARENDPNRARNIQAQQGPLLQPIGLFDKTAGAIAGSIQGSATKTTMEEVRQDKEDGFRFILFAGVLIGFVILLCIFGGPYSPLSLLGSLFGTSPTGNGHATDTTNPIIIPQTDDNLQKGDAEEIVVVPETPVQSQATVASLLIANWRIEPDIVSANIGKELTLKITADRMQ
ncbi:MAG: hypothetical protein QW112_02810, partial [Candidatus Micrarchaeia archaeon]